MRSTLLLILAIGVALLTGGPALSDEPWGFVQITCAPELRYFAIRRFVMMNPPFKGQYLTEGLDPGPAVVSALETKYGIFDSKRLKEQPFECAIPRFEPNARPGFKVRIIGHLDENSAQTSYCRIVDDVEIFLDGRRIALMGLNPCGFASGPDLLEINGGIQLLITICSLDLSDVGVARRLICATPNDDAR
jgi:hypothetical protein